MVLACLQCFASTAYSCFSRAALTAMAVLKVLISITIIIIVAVKLENVTVELQLPVNSLADLTTMAGLANVTSSLMAGGTMVPAPPPTSLSSSPPADSSTIDLNTTAGPLHVDAACLLQKKGEAGQFDGNSKTMCSYVYGVCAISLFATFVMATLLWCTCHLCGWGPVIEMAFAVLGTLWWLVAALVLQENTSVSFDATPAAVSLIVGDTDLLHRVGQPQAAAGFPPPALLPPPPPALPPAPEGTDLMSRLEVLLISLVPESIQQWRQAVVVMAWVMMGMFAACSVLLLVEACGCLLDCCSCLCRCCCPNRPESRWRQNFQRQRRKKMDGEEYVEMAGGVPGMGPNGLVVAGSPPVSWGGSGPPPLPLPPPPGIMVVARSDMEAALSPESSSGGSFEKSKGRRGWWR